MHPEGCWLHSATYPRVCLVDQADHVQRNGRVDCKEACVFIGLCGGCLVSGQERTNDQTIPNFAKLLGRAQRSSIGTRNTSGHRMALVDLGCTKQELEDVVSCRERNQWLHILSNCEGAPGTQSVVIVAPFPRACARAARLAAGAMNRNRRDPGAAAGSRAMCGGRWCDAVRPQAKRQSKVLWPQATGASDAS